MTISPLFKRVPVEATEEMIEAVRRAIAVDSCALYRGEPDSISLFYAAALAASPEPPAQEVETRLLKFFEWALREGPWEGCSLDGESVQDQAESLGLIVKTKLNPAVHGENPVAEPGDDWFVFSDAVQAFRARAKGNG